MQSRVRCFLLSATLLLSLHLYVKAADQEPPGGDELKHLLPHLDSACKIVRDSPEIWPYRSFPYGPLGLEIRKPASASEADHIRNFHLGMVAAACRIPPSLVTASFFCGPECPGNRRDHLAHQLPAVRSLAQAFNALAAIRLVAVWAPEGEFRVNDVFVLNGQAMEAIPSEKLGLVPSGNWKTWPSLGAYLATSKVLEKDVQGLIDQMLAIGLSALIRDGSRTRMVGVGVGDNESGLILLPADSSPPRVDMELPDGRKYTIVVEIAPGIFFYETT